MRSLRVLAVAAVAASCSLLLPALPAYAGTPVDLTVSVPRAQFAPDEAVPLTYTVTNRAGTACGLVAFRDGTVQVTAVTRDGKPVSPGYATADYYDGVEAPLRAGLRTVQPGQQVSFTADGLVAVVALPGGDGLVSRWDTSTPGRYQVTVAYQVPALSGATPCAGTSSAATVAFTVQGGDSGRGLLLGVLIALLVLLIVAGVALLLWRRRRTGAAALALLLLVPAVGVHAHRADARLLSELDVKSAVDACIGKFQAAGDPAGIVPYILDRNTPPVRVHRISDTRDTRPSNPPGKPGSVEIDGNSKHPADGSDIYWDPDPSFDLDGVPVDGCSALYHELTHAVDIGKGALGDALCAGSTIPTKEVRATTAENKYRATQRLGQRKSYHGTTLPPDPSSCEGPKQQELRKQGVCAKAELGTCSRTDGDPHLDTYDHLRYDLQLVGEFVATRATSGDPLEIQLRQAPAGGSRSLSVNSAVAVRMGTHRLGFYLVGGDIVVHRDGKVVTLPSGDTPVPGGGTVTRRPGVVAYSGDGYTVVWPDGSTLWLDQIGGWGLRALAALNPARAGAVTGLFGNDDGNPDNDLTTRSGTAVPVAQATQAGDAWRITDAESLFDYPAGESTATYTDRSFPAKPLTLADLPADRVAAAREVCQQLGVTDPGRLDECTLDVAETGQAVFAASAAQSTADSPPPGTPTPGTSASASPSASGPTTAGSTVRDGSVVNGTLSGGATTYPLDLGGAPGLWVDDTTGSCGVTIAVVPPVGRPYEVSGCYQLPVLVREPDPGTYSIRVSGTGAYAFRLVTLKPRTVPAHLGDQVTGSLEVPGRVDRVQFDASGSTGVRVSGGTGDCDNVLLRVFDATTGERLGLDVPGRLCDGLEQDLTSGTGRYLIEVMSSGGGVSGGYSFHLEGTH